MSAPKPVRQIVDEAFAALARNDMEGFFRDFDDNSELIEVDSLPYGGTYRGKEKIQAISKRIMTEYWHDFAFDVDTSTYGEDCVVTIGTLRGKNPKNGKKWSIPFAEVWKVRAGRVSQIIPIYGDTKSVLDTLT
jgi:uncharacterized protein